MKEHGLHEGTDIKHKKDMDDKFMYYRQAGTGISATLIILSTGAMAWCYKSRFLLSTQAKFFWYVAMWGLGCAILSALFIQFWNYKGYFNHARALLDGGAHQKNAYKYFDWADWAVNIAFGLFIVGMLAALIFWRLDSFAQPG